MFIKKPLKKSNILESITEYDIFDYYCKPFEKLGKKFCSELRKDKTPTCVIVYKDGYFTYKDFAVEGSMSAFDYLMKKYNLSFIEALQKINQDFGLNLISNIQVNITENSKPNISKFVPLKNTNVPANIKIVARKWGIEDKSYWNKKYSFSSKDLERFRIYPLEGYFLNDVYYECKNLTYGYYFGRYEDKREIWKIYSPLAIKEEKWLGNLNSKVIQGKKQLRINGDILIITKGLKDVVALCKIGIDSCAPASENTMIKKDDLDNLKSRFKKIYVLYDNDETGIKSSEKLCFENNLERFFMPEGTKDPSDFLEMYGLEALKEYIYDKLRSNNT